MRDAVSFARTGNSFVLPVNVGGQRLLSFEWGKWVGVES